MPKLNFKKLQEKYGGKYVLMDKPGGKIVAVSKNLGQAFKIAEKKGFRNPFTQFIEPQGIIAIYEVSVSLRN